MCPYPQLSTLLLVHSISTRSVLSYNATDSTPAGIKHTHEIHQKITENHKIKIAITAHSKGADRTIFHHFFIGFYISF